MATLLSRIRTATALVFIALLPTQLGTYYFADFSFLSGVRIDYLALSLFFTDLVALTIIVLNGDALYRFLQSRRLLAVFLLSLATVAFALSPGPAWFRFAKGVEWVLVFGVFFLRPPPLRLVLAAFVAGAAVQAFLVTLQLANKGAIQGLFYFLGERAIQLTTPDAAIATLGGTLFLRPYGSFSHPNSLGGFFVLVFFLASIWEPFRRHPRLRALLLTLSLYLTFVSFSRTAILAFVAGNALLYGRSLLQSTCRICALSRVAVVAMLVLLFASSKGDPLSAQKRFDLMEHSLRIIATYPGTGAGPGNYLVAQAAFPERYAVFFAQPVHNVLLLFLAETGILLGGALFAVAYAPLRRALRNRAFLTCFLVVLGTGMLDHYWLTLQQNFLLTSVVAGLILSPGFPIMGGIPVTIPSSSSPPRRSKQ
jgi:hypothetical protein